MFNLALEKIIRDIPDLKEMEVIGTGSLLAYIDDIILLGEPKHDVKESARKLIKSSSSMGLVVNKKKTKYMVMTRNVTAMGLCVEGLTFE